MITFPGLIALLVAFAVVSVLVILAEQSARKDLEATQKKTNQTLSILWAHHNAQLEKERRNRVAAWRNFHASYAREPPRNWAHNTPAENGFLPAFDNI